MASLLDWMPGRVEALARRVEERIRGFIEETGARWLYVDFSAGKDSAVVLAAAVNCCPGMVVATFLHLAGQTVRDNAVAALETARRLGLRLYRYAPRDPRAFREALLRDRPWEHAPALVYVVTSVNGLDYWRATLKYGFEAPLERFGKGKRWACAKMKNDWLAARPPNCQWRGKPAKCVAGGVRASESRYRARLWAGKTWQVFGEKYQREPDVALAPIVDLEEPDVWALLRYYRLWDVIHPQYERWGSRAPNCALCPLASRANTEHAVRLLPTGYLQRVLQVIQAVRPRYRDGTYSARKIDEWTQIITRELERRGVTTNNK